MTGRVQTARQHLRRLQAIEFTWPRIAFATVTLLFVFMTAGLVAERVAAGAVPWYSDYAIFRQAGHLLASAPEEVYRYVPSTPEARASLPSVWSEYATNHIGPNGNWQGYYYAQSPWQATLMVPFSLVSLRTGYVFFAALMIAAVIAAAGYLAASTRRGWLWGSLLLLVPLLTPVLAGNPWQAPYLSLQWLVADSLRYGSAIGLSLWYGQYTPLLLALLTAGLVAAQQSSYPMAGLLMVLATMKPTVLFVLPAFLLVVPREDWVDLAGYALGWATVVSIPFMMLPGLGYPWRFADLVLSYGGVFVPTLLQAHNWVLYLGIPVAVVALRLDGREEATLAAVSRGQSASEE